MTLEPDEIDHNVTIHVTAGPQAYTETRSGPAEGLHEDGPSMPLAASNGLHIPLVLVGLTVLVLVVWLADALRARREKSASGRHDPPLP